MKPVPNSVPFSRGSPAVFTGALPILPASPEPGRKDWKRPDRSGRPSRRRLQAGLRRAVVYNHTSKAYLPAKIVSKIWGNPNNGNVRSGPEPCFILFITYLQGDGYSYVILIGKWRSMAFVYPYFHAFKTISIKRGKAPHMSVRHIQLPSITQLMQR
jgi:hypothetical protein